MRNYKYWLKYLFPFALGVLVFSFITQYDRTVALFSTIFGGFFYLTSRFIIGFGIAYILNFPMRFFQRKLKMKRWAAIILAYVLTLGIIVMAVWFAVPSIVESVGQILSTSQTYYIQAQELVTNLFGALPEEAQEFADGALLNISSGVMEFLRDLISVDNLGGTLGDILSGSVRAIMNIIFGLFISFYALWDKEKIVLLMKRLIYAVWSRRRADKILEISREADYKFSRFIIGKGGESIVIGLISLIAYTIAGLPVPIFLTFVAAVTNFVPYFGPIVGGVITCVVLLGFSPTYLLIGLIIVIVIQTLDAAVIGPKVLGDACGISPLLVIVAITVGGDLFGLWGILLGVPIVGTFQHVIFDKLLARKLDERGADADAPESPLDGQLEMKPQPPPPEDGAPPARGKK